MVQGKRWGGRGGQQREQWFKFSSPPTSSEAILQTRTLSHTAKTHFLDRRPSVSAGNFQFPVHKEQRRNSEVIRAAHPPRDALGLPVTSETRRGKVPRSREQGVLLQKIMPSVSSLVADVTGTNRRLNFFPSTWTKENISSRTLQARELKEGSSRNRPVSALAS